MSVVYKGIQMVDTLTTINAIIHSVSTKKTDGYLRFGDGDFYLMHGGQDMYASPSPALAAGIRQALTLNVLSMTGINTHCPKWGTMEPEMMPGRFECPNEMCDRFLQQFLAVNPHVKTLHSAVAIHQQLTTNPEKIAELFWVIREHQTLFLGNEGSVQNPVLKTLLGQHLETVSVPERNSFDARNNIVRALADKFANHDHVVLVLAAGCGGRGMLPMILEAARTNKCHIFVLDMGSAIDPFFGLESRAWVTLTPNIQDKINLVLGLC
jgi:hypothetical protein